MDESQRKNRIYVTPDSALFYFVITMLILVFAVSLQKTESLVGRVIIGIMVVTALFYSIYMRFSRKLIAGPRGIVFYKLWRPTVRIRYGQITKIEVSFYLRSTSLRFFKGQECIGLCYSSDTNFDSLFSLLTEVMSEGITYTSSNRL